MKKRFLAVVLAGSMMLSGCAGFLQFNPEVQAKLEQYGEYCTKYVDGAKEGITVLSSVASLIPGAQPYVLLAQAAIQDADLLVQSYQASVQAGKSSMDDLTKKQADIQAAIVKINETVGAIKDQINNYQK